MPEDKDFLGDAVDGTAQAVPVIFIWLGIALVIAAIIGGAGMVYERWAVGQQAQINRASYQNVQGTQEYLVARMGDYSQLQTQIDALSTNPANAATVGDMRNEQHVLLTEMRQRAATIEQSQVPPDVATFLAAHRSQ